MAKKRSIVNDALGVKTKVNGKAKGNKAELMAAKFFQAWTGAEFNRTPMSGGLRWLDASRIAGDLVAPSGFDFPFCVEVKSYAVAEVKEKLRENTIISKFWAQASKDADRAGKLPILLVRSNGMPVGQFTVFVGPAVAAIFQQHSDPCIICISTGMINDLGIFGYNTKDILLCLNFETCLQRLNLHLPSKI